MAKLVVTSGPLEGAEFPLNVESMTLGSGHDCDIRIDHPSVARTHARIQRLGSDWVVSPGGGDATVTVNGSPVQREALRAKDVIEVGEVRLAFTPGGDEALLKASSVELPAVSANPEQADIELVERMRASRKMILREVGKVIIGQSDVIEQMIIALFSGGHVLLVGVPGLAKTLLVSTIAKVVDLDFKRIQFTPDLMPSDITGTDVLEEDRATRKRSFHFIKGPIFTNILLADEINRTPPKTQAALLEAMQEYSVTAGGFTYHLSRPFFVLATQNPIEQEGTYPLPEAQLDRFMFNVWVDYPTRQEEVEVVKTTTMGAPAEPDKVLTGEDVLRLQEITRRVPVSDHVVTYATDLARASRPGLAEAPAFIRELVSWGAGPRAAQYLVLGAKARAILQGRYNVSCDDVRAMALPVLRHRILTNFQADSEGVGVEDIIRRLLESVKEPQQRDY
jgi:MoxR-like ATPase